MSDSRAFDYLVAIADQVKAKGATLPTQTIRENHWSGIGFSLLGMRMITPLDEVVEMLEVPESTRLPGVKPWVTGVANFRGRLLPLFDLEHFFLGTKKAGNKKRRVLVLEIGDLYTGLIVSSVYGLQHLPEDIIYNEPPASAGKVAGYSKGSVYLDGVDWLMFSPFDLVKDPGFFNAAI